MYTFVTHHVSLQFTAEFFPGVNYPRETPRRARIVALIAIFDRTKAHEISDREWISVKDWFYWMLFRSFQLYIYIYRPLRNARLSLIIELVNTSSVDRSCRGARSILSYARGRAGFCVPRGDHDVISFTVATSIYM